MVHQPYEKWIVEQTLLNSEQQQSLEAHLQDCPQCQELNARIHTLDDLLMQAPMAEPAEGFVQRWQTALVEKRAKQQSRQVRRFFLSLLGAGLVTLGLMGFYIALTTSPVALIARLLENTSRVLINLDQVGGFFTFAFRSLPPALSIGIWILLASGLCLFTMIWIGALWRITFQGVSNK